MLHSLPKGVTVWFGETVWLLAPMSRSIVQPMLICAMFAWHQFGLSVQFVLKGPPGVRVWLVPGAGGLVGGTPKMAQCCSSMHQFRVGGPPSWITPATDSSALTCLS